MILEEKIEIMVSFDMKSFVPIDQTLQIIKHSLLEKKYLHLLLVTLLII